MITFEEVCRIIKKRPEPKNQRCDKNATYELPDGWVFCFGKKDVVMCPPISFLWTRKMVILKRLLYRRFQIWKN